MRSAWAAGSPDRPALTAALVRHADARAAGTMASISAVPIVDSDAIRRRSEPRRLLAVGARELRATSGAPRRRRADVDGHLRQQPECANQALSGDFAQAHAPRRRRGPDDEEIAIDDDPLDQDWP